MAEHDLFKGTPGPDSISQALQGLSIPSSSNSNRDGATPSLPPGLAAMHNKTGEEMRAELNKLPLFMTELEENNDLEALRALAYEGTPLEVAQGFKERGTEAFMEKKWVDAKQYYGKGIEVLQAELRRRSAETSKPTPDPTEANEVKEELATLEACLGNRAACNFLLQNYRSCTLDCALVLRLNSKNVKAYLRSGSALLELNRILEADDACARGLAIAPEHKDLKALAEKIIVKNEKVQARKMKEEREAQLKIKEQHTLRAALKARNIKIKTTAQPPEMEDAKVQLVPDPTDPTSSLIFPTVLLYPLHLQSDFIKEFGETETLGSRLGYILAEPAPWDTSREYTLKGTECYMETITGGLIKVGKSITLLKVLGGGNVEVVDDVVRIFVVPKTKAEGWIKDFKMKKAAERKSG